MQRYERGLYPLPTLEGIHGPTVPNIIFELNLPDDVPREEIGVKARLLQSRAKRNGLNTIFVVGDTKGETSKFFGEKIGESPIDGQVLLSDKNKIVPTYSVDITPVKTHKTPKYKAGQQADATITLNIKEMQQRISLREGDIDLSTEWAQEMEMALSSGVMKAGVRHMFKSSTVDNMDTPVTIGAALAGDLIASTNGWSGFGLNGLVLGYLSSMAVMQVGYRIDYARNHPPGEGFRWSILPKEADRALFSWVASQGQRVVKKLPEVKS